jgi:release factor glutamine methyltransferase
MNIADTIAKGAAVLADAGVVEPRREASSLMAYVIGEDAAYLIAHSEDHLAAQYKMMFDACVRRRALHEPFQYITGRQEFYGLDFIVTPDVLIPRPETETLVEAAIEILDHNDDSHFCDIGIGSGCISVAILKRSPKATATGIDISPKALAVAQRNAEAHSVVQRLTLVESNIFESVRRPRFDMIVSNPPYIPSDEVQHLQAEVREYEPHTALAGGKDGLDIIEAIIRGAPDHLKSNGHLLLEVGFDQARRVGQLFDRTVWQTPTLRNDLQQIPRVIVARLR